MKYKYLALLMLGFGSIADAQEQKSQPEAANVVNNSGGQIEALVNEAKGVQDTFMKLLREEKDRAKAMEMFQKERPDMKPYLKKVLDLAMIDPKTTDSAKGLAWVHEVSITEEKKVALDSLMEHHKDGDVMISIVRGMSRVQKPDMQMIRSIMMASNNEKVRQAAMLTLTSIYSRDPGKADEMLAIYKDLAAWPNIAKENPKLLEHVNKQIFVAENLSVGKVAPDIVGTDHEGKEFKLSDYRGKVVMIDFWGIW